MRPRAVVLAEQLYLAAIVVLIVLTVATWRATADAYGPFMAGGAAAFSVGLSLLLLILTTRKASRVGLALLIIWTALNVVGVLVQVSQGVLAAGLTGVLTIIQMVLTVIPIILLFRPRAREWFAGHRLSPVDEVEL